MSYQRHEIEAYFGDFHHEYLEKARKMLDELPWDTIEHYMDDELREELHLALAPCDRMLFLLAYMMKHTERFGEDFEIN